MNGVFTPDMNVMLHVSRQLLNTCSEDYNLIDLKFCDGNLHVFALKSKPKLEFLLRGVVVVGWQILMISH